MSSGTQGHQAFLRARFHTDVGRRYDVDFISPEGYWKSDEQMEQCLIGNFDDEGDAPYGYRSRIHYTAHNAKWGTRSTTITCVGFRNRKGSCRPHEVDPEPDTGKVIVREHKVTASGYGGVSGKRFQCEACGQGAAKNSMAEKRKGKKQSEEKKAKRQKIVASDDPDVAIFKKLKVPQLKEVCRANDLSPTGTKDVLIERLMGCRRHGSHGVCGRCQNANVELEYGPAPSADENKWEAEPIKIACTRWLTSMTYGSVPCGWSEKITPKNKLRVLSNKLMDTDAGDLVKAGMVLI